MKLRDWRTQNNVTLAHLSEAVGVSLGQLSHLERGTKSWSVDLAKRVEAFTRGEVSAASLLGLAETRRARRGVREEAGAFDASAGLTINVPFPPEREKLLRESSINAAAIDRASAEKELKEAKANA